MERLGSGASMIDYKLRRQHARTLQLDGLTPDMFIAFCQARFCVVGAGGLASGFLPVIAAMGAQHLTVIDDDVVAPSNLPRQLLYTQLDLGQPKVSVADKVLRGYAPGGSIRPVQARLTECNVDSLLQGIDLVVDCSDNFPTRYLLDRACRSLNTPLLYGAVSEALGQITLLHGNAHVALSDIFGPQPDAVPPPAVFPPAVHLVGTIMASEAFKWTTGYGSTLDGALLQIDLRTNEHLWLPVK